jgi:hypothetical protein
MVASRLIISGIPHSLGVKAYPTTHNCKTYQFTKPIIYLGHFFPNSFARAIII